jgi:hypothetical protein
MSTEIHIVKDKPRANFEALQFDGTNGGDIVGWMDDAVQDAGGNHDGNFHANVIGGILYMEPGDWIIRRGYFNYDTVTNEMFEKIYERLS